MAAALNVGVGEVEQPLTDHVFRARDWWVKKKAAGEGCQNFDARFISSEELEKMDAYHSWLIKNILVRDQPVLMGGPKKSLKTSIMLDAAISLGTGKPFLGKFEVPERVKVSRPQVGHVATSREGRWMGAIWRALIGMAGCRMAVPLKGKRPFPSRGSPCRAGGFDVGRSVGI